MRLLFATDVHGSTAVIRKAAAAVREFDADALLVAGDLCGKQLVPIVKGSGGMYFAGHNPGRRFDSSGLPAVQCQLEDAGWYWHECSAEELDELRADSLQVQKIMLDRILARLEAWKTLLVRELDPRSTALFLTPGNDDPFEIDALLLSFESEGIRADVRQPYAVGRNFLITLDHTPPTPWKTPREATEDALREMIRCKLAGIPDPGLGIFNFHCPPARTRLDLAPALDRQVRPVFGLEGQKTIHAGSEAVRAAIEEYQPAVGLHGHIHESPGEEHLGGTLCLNPGSEYWNGVLRGYLVDLGTDGRVIRYHRIER